MGKLYSSDAFYSYPTIMYFKPEFTVSFAPCTTCGRRGASKEKKSVGSWFVAESAPLGWGALVKIFTTSKVKLRYNVMV